MSEEGRYGGTAGQDSLGLSRQLLRYLEQHVVGKDIAETERDRDRDRQTYRKTDRKTCEQTDYTMGFNGQPWSGPVNIDHILHLTLKRDSPNESTGESDRDRDGEKKEEAMRGNTMC